MRYRAVGVLAIGAIGAGMLQAGLPCHHCMRAPRVCCVPAYDYRLDGRSAIVTGVTYQSDALLRQADSTWSGQRGKLMSFALKESQLKIDHCSISKVGIALEETGNWSVNFTARQNPMDVVEAERPKFVRFKRNRFYVTLKLFGQYALATDPATSDLAQPQMVELRVPAFWLEQGQSDNRFYSDESVPVARHFDVITRVEVDFQYE